MTEQSEPTDDSAVAVVEHGDGYDGVGWYYWDQEYPDEGSVGAFETREEAVAHAATGGYRVEASSEEKP